MTTASDFNGAFNAIFREAEATLSVISITSTATASDLPGAGRTLGNLYSYFGKRLETLLSRLAERHGYGPTAIEKRVLVCIGSPPNPNFPVPGSKRDRKLRKDLTRLVRYTQSNIDANRALACQTIISLTLYHKYFCELFCELDALKTFAVILAREKVYGETDCLLSPSRKALLCIAETEINTIGRNYSLLALQFMQMVRRSRLHDPSEQDLFYSAHLNAHEKVVEYIGSRHPERSFLALCHFTEVIRDSIRNRRFNLPRNPDSPQSVGEVGSTRKPGWKAENTCLRSRFQQQYDGHKMLERSIIFNLKKAPSDVDWHVLELGILQMQIRALTLQRKGKLCRCSAIA
ncbi:uncharacterized protein FOMMEDRAFT_31069 [Fomitiporia mediterranea MF3/22]|uniref:uncharacterized protein n=1 Tax=Fomitiporia mediterranea (strain MF3/22) TaxID=694068 RepID=UPI0004409CC6|nr:uncharacterized protein FOMMEDRAFT_31069 [Fomitiporia mediterranea MF3/22]EJC99807.1 hypothetical protein FOMMEDRAFT_31069 [Fomitiporia mediterranea MF3/22]